MADRIIVKHDPDAVRGDVLGRPLIRPTDCPAEDRYRPRGALHTRRTWNAVAAFITYWKHLLKTFWGWHDRQLPDGTVGTHLPDRRW